MIGGQFAKGDRYAKDSKRSDNQLVLRDRRRGRDDERRLDPRVLYDKYIKKTDGPKGFLPIFLQVTFYLSIITLLGFILLVILQFLGFPVFSFIPGDIGAIPIIAPTNRQVQFKNAPISVDASANFVNLLPYKYTISFDTNISSEFVSQSVPRILLYRSQKPIQFMSSDTFETIDNRLVFSNILVYLDPMKNDLYVRVYTGPTTARVPSSITDTSTSTTDSLPYTIDTDGNKVFTASDGTTCSVPPGTDATDSTGETVTDGTEETATEETTTDETAIDETATEDTDYTGQRLSITSDPIQNVPLRTPFRITIMLTDVLLEVYLNGELQRSVPLKLPPTTINDKSLFYGPPALSRQSASVSNISYWNTVLTSRAIRIYGGEPFLS